MEKKMGAGIVGTLITLCLFLYFAARVARVITMANTVFEKRSETPQMMLEPTTTPRAAAEAPSPSPSHTDTPTLAETSAPTSTPRPTPVTPAGYVSYTNTDLGFSAIYPDTWEVETGDYPDLARAVGKWVAFHRPLAAEEIYRELVYVEVIVMDAVEKGHYPTDEEYFEFITEWTAVREQELLVNPSMVEVSGYRAVQTVYSGTDLTADPSGMYSLVGYASFLVTDDRLFFIEGVAATENQDAIRRQYEHFISSFDVLPLP